MARKTVIALSVSVIFYFSYAQAVLAREPMSTRGATDHSHLQYCHPQDFGSLSPSSDFVAIPYTFGNKPEYRPVWIPKMQARTGRSGKMAKGQTAPSPVPDC